MNCKIKINNEQDQAQICDWSSDCDSLINAALNLLPHQIESRVYSASLVFAASFSAYLRAKGVAVDVQFADPEAQKRMAPWLEKLKRPAMDSAESSGGSHEL